MASRRSTNGAEYAGRLPEELCGYLAELARCTSRAFIELFGCDNAPQRVKGAADMLLQKVPSKGGAYFVIRPGLMRAMAEADLFDPMVSAPEEHEEGTAPAEPRPTAAAPRPSAPAAKMPSGAAKPAPVRQPAAANARAVRHSGSPGGFLGDVARMLSPLAGSARSAVPVPGAAAGAEKSSPATAKAERNPFSLLHWADPDS